MNALRILTAAGLALRTDGDRLLVTPAAAITAPLRRLILDRKSGLLASVRAAESQAEQLRLRDLDGDDRRLCAECHHGRSSRCPDGEPLPGVLQRCPAFKEAQ